MTELVLVHSSFEQVLGHSTTGLAQEHSSFELALVRSTIEQVLGHSSFEQVQHRLAQPHSRMVLGRMS